MDWICSRCGKRIFKREDYHAGFCIDCYMEEHPPPSIPTNLEVSVCPRCSRYKVKDKWIASKLTDFSNIIFEAAYNEISKVLHYGVNIIEVKPIQRLEDVGLQDFESQIPVTVSISHKDPEGRNIIIQQTAFLTVHRIICPECARSHREAYEAIIQIRAKNRVVDAQEQLKILNYIQGLVQKTRAGLLEHSLTKVKQVHSGVDLYFSSNSLAKKISNYIVSEFGCFHKSSEKISGRDKSGRTRFKVVYSLRLPDFRPGDIIEWNGRNYLLESISGGKAHIIDILTDQKTSIPLAEAWRTTSIIKKESFIKFLIISVEDNTVELMDSKTYEVFTVNKPAWLVKTGMEVYGFISKKGVISLIPRLK